MKLYCSSCGTDNTYTISKPNFCQKCGNSFSQAKASVDARLGEAVEDKQPESVPNINKLDFEIEGVEGVKGIPLATLGQLAPDLSSSSSAKTVKKKAPKISKKKVLEQFRKEAGAIRPNG